MPAHLSSKAGRASASLRLGARDEANEPRFHRHYAPMALTKTAEEHFPTRTEVGVLIEAYEAG
jgi:hypothetical protein